MNEIFVFGSNLAGRHGAGAALQARQHHGAVYGVGAGRTGDAYAIPTKDAQLRVLPLERIAPYVREFVAYAHASPDLRFKVTRIGCGLAGYADADIAPLFAGAPANCRLPDSWPSLAVSPSSAPTGRNPDAASPADIPTTVRSHLMSNENTPASEGGNQPYLRYKDDVALWPSKEGSKHALSGHITLDGQKTQVLGFINTTDRDGNQLKQPYVSLSRNTAAQGEEAKWETVATGNAMNSRSDGKPVYFDQVIFNVKGQENKTFNAYVAKACPEDFQQSLGFTSPVAARPAKEQPAASAEETAEEEEDADRPRP